MNHTLSLDKMSRFEGTSLGTVVILTGRPALEYIDLWLLLLLLILSIGITVVMCSVLLLS